MRVFLSNSITNVVLFTIVGLFVRLYNLGIRSFWYDEVAFAHAMRLPSLGDVIPYTQQWVDHTPISFILIWLMRGLGSDEVAVRLPFAIAGTLGIPAIYLLGKTLSQPRVGVYAAMLYALSPFAVFISQDAHPYAPLMLFTILQITFTYRAATVSHPLDWAGLTFFTLLNFYNDYLALIVTAVTGTFLGIVLVGKIVAVVRTSPETRRLSISRLGIQSTGLVGMTVAVTIFFLPWLTPTITFLKTTGLTVYVAHPSASIFDALGTLAGGLGLDMFLALLLLVGAFHIVLHLRKLLLSAGLLFIWTGVPLAGLFWLVGDHIFSLQTPYYCYLLPAIFIVAAFGVHQCIELLTGLDRRFFVKGLLDSNAAGRVPLISFAVTPILLLFTIPPLVGSYSWPKTVPQQFKEATALIVTDSPPGSIVVSIGMWNLKPAPSSTVEAIDHYLWVYKSSIRYEDASSIDQYTNEHLGESDSIVWGAYVLPSQIDPKYVQSAHEMGLETIQFQGVTLIRQNAPRGTPAQQLDKLLAWGVALQPGLAATRALLNSDYRVSALSENILPPASNVQIPAHGDALLNGEQQPDKWVLWGKASLASDGKSLELTSPDASSETNITLSTSKLTPGATYVLMFHYRNKDFQGKQRVYMSLNEDNGILIDTLPYGDGFYCTPDSDSASAFAFKVPTITTNALLWLRIDGKGTADFSDIELRLLH